MKVTIIGTGYVGLPTGVGLAELGHQVVCVDQCEKKISNLAEGIVPIFEKGLEDLFLKNQKANRIHFTTSLSEAMTGADIILIAVGTPPHPETQEADMKYIYAAASQVANHLEGYTVVAIKSTVPVGTGDEVERILNTANPKAEVDVVSLPEFLREGFAVHDFFNPDRIVVGSNSNRAIEKIKELYLPLNMEDRTLFVSRRSSETIKYASNAFLAMKIHYINEMANFCEKSGADISEVAKGMGLDSRIGAKFLNPGPGYGGSCFPKDTKAMARMAEKYDVDLSLVKATIEGNSKRKKEMAQRVLDAVADIDTPRIAALGLAFKAGTDDCRDSPAIDIITEILKFNSNIITYDPKGTPSAKLILNDKVEYANSALEAIKGADAIVVLTEWDEFKSIDLKEVKSLMKSRIIVDLRNIFDAKNILNMGFKYVSAGGKSEEYFDSRRSGLHRVTHSQTTAEPIV